MPAPASPPGLPEATEAGHPAPPSQSPGTYAGQDSVAYLMKQIMVSFVAQADRRLGALGLTHAQWVPLVRLRLTGASTVVDLARWLNADAGATTRLLDRLEKKGLCRRSRSSTDRRVVHVAITNQGLAATAQAPAVLKDILDAHLAGFSAAESSQLIAMLRRMRDNGEALRQSEPLHEAP